MQWHRAQQNYHQQDSIAISLFPSYATDAHLPIIICRHTHRSFSLEKAKINGETKRLTAEIDAGLIKVTAEAEATSALNKAEADAKAIKVQLESEKASYKALYDSIQAKYSGSGTEFGIQQLLAYMRTETITNTDAQAVTVAVDQVVV